MENFPDVPESGEYLPDFKFSGCGLCDGEFVSYECVVRGRNIFVRRIVNGVGCIGNTEPTKRTAQVVCTANPTAWGTMYAQMYFFFIRVFGGTKPYTFVRGPTAGARERFVVALNERRIMFGTHARASPLLDKTVADILTLRDRGQLSHRIAPLVCLMDYYFESDSPDQSSN